MSKPVHIDFVSDIVCPWCALGLASLQTAIARVPDIKVTVTCQPFELNPDMPATGEDTFTYLNKRHGLTRQQYDQSQQMLKERGAPLKFDFGSGTRFMHNTFNAHRLLAWAENSGKQVELARVLAKAYFTDGVNLADQTQLLALIGEVGLNVADAQKVLSSDAFANEVRAKQKLYRDRGISGVPGIIFNGEHLIQGGQPPEVFEQAIRQLAQQ